MSKKKEELGKGIRALLSGIDEDLNTGESPSSNLSTDANEGSILRIPLEQIEVNPFQPRSTFDEEGLQDLADSISVHGVIQPITVRKAGKDKYQLIAGERRLRASKMVGNKDIPAYIRVANDQESLEIALIENIQREDLNAVEIGINYKRLMEECDLTQSELAERVGKKRSTITNFLRLLKLPPDVQAAVRDGSLSMGHARAILGVEEVDYQLRILDETLEKSLSVRQVEQLVRRYKNGPNTGATKTKKAKSKSLEVMKVEDQLSSRLSTKVTLHPSKDGKGELRINYYSNVDLERLMDIILNQP